MITKKYIKHVCTEVFYANNLLILFANIIVFLIFIILFFWYILSKQFDYVILEKIDIISLLAKKDKKFRDKLILYLYSNESLYEVPQKAAKQSSEREAYNFKILQDEVFPFVYVNLICFFLILIYIKIKKIKILFVEYILLLFVLCAFFTEIIFYFVIIKEWQFIGDYELLYNFFLVS